MTRIDVSCSIIICTYNRAEHLNRTLQSLIQQDYYTKELEILVVDNGSKDHTADVIKSVANYAVFPIRYIYESQLGISFARNRGVEEAQGEVVIFIDDDAIPEDPNWVATLAEQFRKPEVCVAGGDLIPIWPNGHKPKWLHDFLIPPLGITDFKLNEVTQLHYPNYPWGANISYRTSSVLLANGFSSQFGWSSAGPMVSGEETELNLRIEKNYGKVIYVPNAAVFHTISPGKLTKEWIMKRAESQGVSDANIHKIHYPFNYRAFHIFLQIARILVFKSGLLYYSLRQNNKMHHYLNYRFRYSLSYIMSTFY